MKPGKNRKSLEEELEELKTNEESRKRLERRLAADLPDGNILHEGDVDLYIEDLKEEIENYKKLEQFESKFKK